MTLNQGWEVEDHCYGCTAEFAPSKGRHERQSHARKVERTGQQKYHTAARYQRRGRNPRQQHVIQASRQELSARQGQSNFQGATPMNATFTSTAKYAVAGIFAFVLAFTLLLGTPAQAATFTWTGGDVGTGDWSDTDNWSGGAPTSNAATDLIFSTNTNGLNPNNNIANPFLLNSMTFNAALPAVTVTGSQLQFNGSRTITQNSDNKVTINNTLSHNTTNVTMVFAGTGTGDLEIAGTYMFPHQSSLNWNNGSNYNLILNRIDMSTRTSTFNNNNATLGKELRFNGDINFTAVNDPTSFILGGAGTSIINGQLKYVGGASGSFVMNPSAGGTIKLNNAAGNFASTMSGTFQGAGTIDLGGFTHTLANLTYSSATATNGNVAFQNFFLDYGTVNIGGTDAAGFNGNLIKRDVTNNDAFINSTFTHTGLTKLIASDITLQGANGSVNQSSIEFDVVNRNGENSMLHLNNTAANNNNRINDNGTINMTGGEIRLTGNAAVASQENMGAVTFRRQVQFQIDAQGGGVASLTGDSITRSNGGTLYVTGDNLGNAAGANVGQLRFDLAPLTTAGVLGTTSAPTVPWAAGSNAFGSNNAQVLTYDPATGFRPLTASEYVLNSFAAASGANVRITSNTNLTGSDLAIKSLTFVPASNGTFTIGGVGTETLTVTDGVIVASQTNQAPVDVLNVSKLTFGNNAVTGYEGIFHVYGGGGFTVNSSIIDNAGNAVSLTKAGSGELRLGGSASNITGGLRVNEGNVRFTNGSSTTLSDITIDTTLNGSLTLDAGSNVTTTGSGNVLTVKRPLGGTAIGVGSGTLNLSGNVLVDYSAVGGSTASTTFGNNFGLGAVDRTFTINNSPAGTDATFSGAIGGTGGLVKAGAGLMSLTGANTYIGNTTIQAGQLQVADVSGVLTSSSLITINPGTSLLVDNSVGNNNNNNRLSNTGTVESIGGTLRFTGNTAVASSETLGTLKIGTGSTTMIIDALAGGAASFTANTLSRPGHGTVILLGDSLGSAGGPNVGQFFLGSAPTLVGGTLGTTSAAIMPFFAGDTTLTADPSRETGSLVTYDTNGYRLVNRSTEMTGTLTSGVNWFTTGGTVTSDIAVNSIFVQHSANIGGSAGRTLTVNSGMIMHASGYDTLNISVPFLTFGNNPVTGSEGIFYVNRVGGGTTNVSSVMVDNGPNSVSVTKFGGGVLNLSGANLYSGATTVNAGTMTISGADNRLPVGTVLTVASGAVFDLNNFNQTVRGLEGTGTTTNSSANMRTFTINSTGTSDSFSGGGLSGNLNLIKTGAGTQTLTGTNTFAGSTTVNQGTLAIAGTLNAGPVTVNSGGTLAGTGTINLPGSQLVTVNNNGALAPGGLGQAGTLTINGGLALNSNSLLHFDLGDSSLASTSDHVVIGGGVNGNLVLDGVLDVTTLPSFSSGVFTLFTYTGNLTDNGLILTTNAYLGLTLDLSVMGQVNLITSIPAPEPSSFLLLGLGLLALRRKSRRSAVQQSCEA